MRADEARAASDQQLHETAWAAWASGVSAPCAATKLIASRYAPIDSPASPHQPVMTSCSISPRSMYALLTSVISSSPRPYGLSVLMISNTEASYMYTPMTANGEGA